jgi:hypothetical protein
MNLATEVKRIIQRLEGGFYRGKPIDVSSPDDAIVGAYYLGLQDGRSESEKTVERIFDILGSPINLEESNEG